MSCEQWGWQTHACPGANIQGLPNRLQVYVPHPPAGKLILPTLPPAPALSDEEGPWAAVQGLTYLHGTESGVPHGYSHGLCFVK